MLHVVLTHAPLTRFAPGAQTKQLSESIQERQGYKHPGCTHALPDVLAIYPGGQILTH